MRMMKPTTTIATIAALIWLVLQWPIRAVCSFQLSSFGIRITADEDGRRWRPRRITRRISRARGTPLSLSTTTPPPPARRRPQDDNKSMEKKNHNSDDQSSAQTTPITTTPRYEALLALLPTKGHAFPVDRLDQSPTFGSLAGRDRAMARLLVATVMRRQGQLDVLVQQYAKENQNKNQNGNKENNSNNPPTKSKKKKPKKPHPADAYVTAVLRLGLAQLLFLHTPPHAAVKETVDLLRMASNKGRSQDGNDNASNKNNKNNKNKKPIQISPGKIQFVNAVLRRVARDMVKEDNHDDTSTTRADTINAFVARHSSIMDNASPWLTEQFTRAWGPARTRLIVESAMQELPRYLTVKTTIRGNDNDKNEHDDTTPTTTMIMQRVAAKFQAAARNKHNGNHHLNHNNNNPNDDTTTTSIPTFTPAVEIFPRTQQSLKLITPPPGKVSDWPGYHEGDWWLQDPSATLPALALQETLFQDHTPTGPPSLHVVDLCAAPGGKTAQLCCFLGNNHNNNKITAVEVSPRRSRRLEENLKRLGLLESCNVQVADGTEWLPPLLNDNDENGRRQPIHGVLLDAPCTATGTGGRRPDVLHKGPDCHAELEPVQFDLACHAADRLLDVGGILVYATCSLLPQEGEDQMRRLLERSSDGDADDVAVLETIPFTPDSQAVPPLPGCVIDENGWLRIFPQPDNQMDGFFVARFRKVR